MVDNPFVQAEKVPQPAKKDFSTDLNEVFNEIANLSRRVRVIEEQYINLRKKIQVIEQNILGANKRLQTQVETLNNEITELTLKLEEQKENMRLIVKELKVGAKKEEVDILRKYIQMWEPINFVSHSEAEKLVREIVRDELSRRNS